MSGKVAVTVIEGTNVEIDHNRGVIYVHWEGRTIIRITAKPGIPEVVESKRMLDIRATEGDLPPDRPGSMVRCDW